MSEILTKFQPPHPEGFGEYEKKFLSRLQEAHEKLRQSSPNTTAHHVTHEGTHFLLYADGVSVDLAAADASLSVRLLQFMDMTHHLPPKERDTCLGFSKKLHAEGLTTNVAYLHPLTANNIRGTTEFHVIGEITEADSFAYVDGTCPQKGSPEAKAAGFPSGIIILASQKEKAREIAQTLYDAWPDNSNRRLVSGYN